MSYIACGCILHTLNHTILPNTPKLLSHVATTWRHQLDQLLFFGAMIMKSDGCSTWDISTYGGFLKLGTPKSSISSRMFLYKPSILGYPIYGNPYICLNFPKPVLNNNKHSTAGCLSKGISPKTTWVSQFPLVFAKPADSENHWVALQNTSPKRWLWSRCVAKSLVGVFATRARLIAGHLWQSQSGTVTLLTLNNVYLVAHPTQ
jgi:hypothetical protein